MTTRHWEIRTCSQGCLTTIRVVQVTLAVAISLASTAPVGNHCTATSALRSAGSIPSFRVWLCCPVSAMEEAPTVASSFKSRITRRSTHRRPALMAGRSISAVCRAPTTSTSANRACSRRRFSSSNSNSFNRTSLRSRDSRKPDSRNRRSTPCRRASLLDNNSSRWSRRSAALCPQRRLPRAESIRLSSGHWRVRVRQRFRRHRWRKARPCRPHFPNQPACRRPRRRHWSRWSPPVPRLTESPWRRRRWWPIVAWTGRPSSLAEGLRPAKVSGPDITGERASEPSYGIIAHYSIIAPPCTYAICFTPLNTSCCLFPERFASILETWRSFRWSLAGHSAAN